MDRDKQLEYLRGLEKLKASKVKSEDYTSPLDQDVMRVKGKAPGADDITRIKGMTEKIDTKGIAPIISGKDFKSKIESLLKSKAGKKSMKILPLAGVASALLSGEPAMAAEELAQDAMGPAGVAYQALRSEDAGNRAEEREMLAERDAIDAYKKSQAYRDRRGISDDEALIEEAIQTRKPKTGGFSRLRKMFGAE